MLGGICRRPGPNVSVFFLPVPVGKALWGIMSPGRTTVSDVAMATASSVCDVAEDEIMDRRLLELLGWPVHVTKFEFEKNF